MTDPREQPLNDVARRIMVQSNYDPHFSGLEDRVLMETKLFLARFDALTGYQMTLPKNGNGQQWQHRETQAVVTELGRGLMQSESAGKGTRLIAYRDEVHNRVMFNTESDFHSQYEPL